MPEVVLTPVVSDQNYDKESVAFHRKKKPIKVEANWLYLPYEVWLSILLDYGVTARDLTCLEQTCSWFSWKGLTEDAARLLLKKMSPQIGELANRVHGETWKEKLFHLQTMLDKLPKLSAGSYQNISIQNGKVFTWGAGRFGQLGNNVRLDKARFQDITPSIPQESGQVVQVSAGCGHSGLITEQGHAYTFGDNRYHQLGHTPQRGQTCAFPTRIGMELNTKRIVQIACGSSHTLFLTDIGQMYVNGQGDSGQLGLGERQGIAQYPTLVPFPYDEYSIVYITTGIAHNILLTHCGRAFTYGLATAGQLGHGGTKKLYQPTMVSVLRQRKITFAAAGVSHSIFVDSEGLAYTCGKGRGILGHAENRIRTVPTKVDSLETQGVKVTRAAAGVGRSIFISSEGQGYWCGEGMGELANHTTNSPTAIPLPEALVAASVGNSHTVLQMKSGRLMSFGNNGRFQTGIAEDEDAFVGTYTYIDAH